MCFMVEPLQEFATGMEWTRDALKWQALEVYVTLYKVLVNKKDFFSEKLIIAVIFFIDQINNESPHFHKNVKKQMSLFN